MFKKANPHSIVTAIIPSATTRRVVQAAVEEKGATALSWKARGTLLREDWLSRFMPPIGPVKSVLTMVVPQAQVDSVIATTIESGKLHQQATGAVFSTPCEHAWLGSEFHRWPGADDETSTPSGHSVSESLNVIYCIVGQALSDRVARAAVDAGAHGPVIYFAEGRGLRDRIGWLRITKEHQQEVQMVIVDDAHVEEVFEAMARAGEFHKPGRGLMYRLSIDKGMFNLPSSFARHRYPANMQQIIRAIDHLAGHTHWRDQSVFDVGGEGKVVGLAGFERKAPESPNRVCLTAVVKREQMKRMMDLILDSGATGLNMTFGRFLGGDQGEAVIGARIHDEYTLLRSIVDPAVAEYVCRVVDDTAEDLGVRDMCMLVNPIARISTYVPGNIDYREASPEAAA